ncbi:MAG: hypothetical protein HC929_01215 [Leptolyngbyaceae cyanobacterium SM2_5_2]|nr:hypothetical protein [Leptolyngbyaceae cyanobacterium SM2_5_2]
MRLQVPQQRSPAGHSRQRKGRAGQNPGIPRPGSARFIVYSRGDCAPITDV